MAIVWQCNALESGDSAAKPTRLEACQTAPDLRLEAYQAEMQLLLMATCLPSLSVQQQR